MNFCWLASIFVLFGSLETLATNPVEKPPLSLGQGEQRLLRIAGLMKYSLGSNIVRALPIQDRNTHLPQAAQSTLLLKGVHPGVTDLWVWKKDGTSEFRTIRVEKLASNKRNIPLEQSLNKLTETEIIYSGQTVVLRGEITSPQEMARVAALLHSFPKELYDETVLSQTLIQQGYTQVFQWIQRTGYSDQIRIEKVGSSLWIRGNLNRPNEKPTIEQQIRAIFPKIHFELETLPDFSPVVHFQVFLIELRKSHFGSLGISWPAQVENSFLISKGGIQDLYELGLTLRHLEGNGNARILSNPELVVRIPGEAELFAGGELPIQLHRKFYSNISWKNYGLTLRLHVTHSAGNRVRLDILTEVSSLDSTTQLDQIPGIQTNRLKTQVDANYGTPLFLSGLFQQKTREEAKGLPFLKNIPILGRLFGSEDYLNERSELVAILYPQSTPPSISPALSSIQKLPRGDIPVPRNWISPEDERSLRESKDFPWNVLD